MDMKKLLLLSILACVTLSSSAQLLWKVSGNGLEKPSYLLGTMHLAPAAMIDWIPGMNEALENCEVVIGEKDYDDHGTGNSSFSYLLPPDSTLDKLYSPEDYLIVQEMVSKITDNELFKRAWYKFHPVMIGFAMDMMLFNKDLEFDYDNFIDAGVMKRVIDMGKPSMGLETSDFQRGLTNEEFFGSSIAEDADSLLAVCKNPQKYVHECMAHYGVYMSQRYDLIEEFFQELDPEEAESTETKLVYDRNHDWMTKLPSLMAERSCLVCVGIGHFASDQGLLQLLRNAGYTVEPMQ